MPGRLFTVAPGDQQRLVDLLVEVTQAVMNRMPGFVSANLHKSLDGTIMIVVRHLYTASELLAVLAQSTPEMQLLRVLLTFY